MPKKLCLIKQCSLLNWIGIRLCRLSTYTILDKYKIIKLMDNHEIRPINHAWKTDYLNALLQNIDLTSHD